MSPGKGLKKLKSLLSSSLGSNALPSTPPSPAVRQLCRLRFFSLLQECSSRTAPRNPDGEQQPEWDEDTDSDNGEPGSPRSRSCRTSLVLGIAALLLAGLGLVPPTFWTSLPALVAGLVAVYTGLVGAGETGTTSGEHLRGRGEAMAGISLGTLGMFLPRLLQMWL